MRKPERRDRETRSRRYDREFHSLSYQLIEPLSGHDPLTIGVNEFDFPTPYAPVVIPARSAPPGSSAKTAKPLPCRVGKGGRGPVVLARRKTHRAHAAGACRYKGTDRPAKPGDDSVCSRSGALISPFRFQFLQFAAHLPALATYVLLNPLRPLVMVNLPSGAIDALIT
jgi:hypothetical protein